MQSNAAFVFGAESFEICAHMEPLCKMHMVIVGMDFNLLHQNILTF